MYTVSVLSVAVAFVALAIAGITESRASAKRKAMAIADSSKLKGAPDHLSL